MSDIIERLLNRAANAVIIKDKPNLYYDAAHEIERLRAENEKLRDAYDTDALTISYNLGYTCGKDIAKDEIEKLHREAAIRIDQIAREQEAHLKTMAELNEQIASSQQLRDLIAKYSQQYVRMREALKPFAYYASQIPDDVSNTASASGTVGDLRAAAAAIRESGNE